MVNYIWEQRAGFYFERNYENACEITLFNIKYIVFHYFGQDLVKM